MRKILLLITLLVCLFASSYAQEITTPIAGTSANGAARILGKLYIDSLLYIPLLSDTPRIGDYLRPKRAGVEIAVKKSFGTRDSITIWFYIGDKWDRIVTDFTNNSSGSPKTLTPGFGLIGSPYNTSVDRTWNGDTSRTGLTPYNKTIRDSFTLATAIVNSQQGLSSVLAISGDAAFGSISRLSQLFMSDGFTQLNPGSLQLWNGTQVGGIRFSTDSVGLGIESIIEAPNVLGTFTLPISVNGYLANSNGDILLPQFDSSTETIQQVLINGSSLSQDNVIAANGHNFGIDNPNGLTFIGDGFSAGHGTLIGISDMGGTGSIISLSTFNSQIDLQDGDNSTLQIITTGIMSLFTDTLQLGNTSSGHIFIPSLVTNDLNDTHGYKLISYNDSGKLMSSPSINHLPVAAATTTVLPGTPQYSDPGDGWQATLTPVISKTALTIDGYTLIVGDRILVKNQTLQWQNGIYTVTQQGDGVTNKYILTRGNYASIGQNMIAGSSVYVTGGTTNLSNTFVQRTTGTIYVGGSNLVYTSNNPTLDVVLAAGNNSTRVIAPGNVVSSGSIVTATRIANTIGRVGINSTATLQYNIPFMGPGSAYRPYIELADSTGLGIVDIYAPLIGTGGTSHWTDIFIPNLSANEFIPFSVDGAFSNNTGNIALQFTGDITTTSGSSVTTYNNVVPSNKGGAGTINGILKANGSGTTSLALSGTDYVVPSTLSSYLLASGATPLAANWSAGPFIISNIFTSIPANTVFDGRILSNITPAAATLQQYSPAIHYIGQGWKTTSTAASQSVDVREYLVPMQGTTTPSYQMVWDGSVNGGGYSPIMQLGNGVTMTTNGLNLFNPTGGPAQMGVVNPGAGNAIIAGFDLNNGTDILRLGNMSSSYIVCLYSQTQEVARMSGTDFLIGTTTDIPSSKFTVSTTTKGSIPFPIMTNTQMNAISAPVDGDHVHNSSFGKDFLYNGTAWIWTTPITGTYSSTGTATTAFTVTLANTMPNSTYTIGITPTDTNAATSYSISAETTTSFTVTYVAGLTGAVAFQYSLTP